MKRFHLHFLILTAIVSLIVTIIPAQVIVDGSQGAGEPYTVATNSAVGIDTNSDFGFGDAAKSERITAVDDDQYLYIFVEGSLHSSNRLFTLIDSDANEATGWSGAHPDGSYGESDALEFFTDVADGGYNLTISVEGYGNPTEEIYAVALAYTGAGPLADEVYLGNLKSTQGDLTETVNGASGTLKVGIVSGDGANDGIELGIPRSWLAGGGGLSGTPYRLAALNGNNTNDFWSNSTIPANALTDGNNIGNDVANSGVMAGLTAPKFNWATSAGETPIPTPTPAATPTPTPTPVVTPSPSGITIGQGPELGTTAGSTWYEEFQDWKKDDCRGLDPWGDSGSLGDGGDNARDLVALYSRDDPAGDNVFFRVDFLDNYYNAEFGSLDVYILLDLNSPDSGAQIWPDSLSGTPNVRWEVAVCVYDAANWSVYDASQTVLSNNATNPELFRGAYFHGDLDSVEFGIARSILTSQGWDGSSPILMQAGTAKDLQAVLTDTLPDSGGGGAPSNGSCATAKYAYILHGNQAISPSASIQGLIYNNDVKTPNGNPTGYHRALDTARIFNAPPNIHISATLIVSSLWADRPGSADPQDGPEFIDYIKEFLDGNLMNGEGAIVWGVFSEHIMPFFEGSVNHDSISLNENYLEDVLSIPAPNANSIFWIPERVTRGSTFSDLVDTGYGWSVLDQTQHLRSWFGENGQGHKIHRINGVNNFMINDLSDRFKFANTDGGLWMDTRKHLIDMAEAVDQEQITVVFDDWEAYAGRSFLSFNQGSDNPDNFNTNIRWLANHQWVQIVTLEEVAGWAWTPVDHGANPNLPFETYDYLDYATEQSYENWYKGSPIEEDFDDYFPWIREDKSQAGSKKFGGLASYGASTTGATAGPGTIAEDVYLATFGAEETELKSLARLAYATAIFETAWHDEDSAHRCGDVFCAWDCDGTCEGDSTFDNISNFAKQLQFLNLRRSGIISSAANWTASGTGGLTNREALDIDHDGELEYVLANDFVYAVFENDGGRLIAAFARDPETSRTASLIGNLIGFPDHDDEREANFNNNARRVSGLSDWWATGPDTNMYVNDIYTISEIANGWAMTSSDGKIQKKLTLESTGKTIQTAYTLDPSITTLYVRNGLSPDIENLMRSGQFALQLTDVDGKVALANTQTGTVVSLDYGDGGHNAMYNSVASDGTQNSPRNMALLHMVELSGSGSFNFGITLDVGGSIPSPQEDGWILR